LLPPILPAHDLTSSTNISPTSPPFRSPPPTSCICHAKHRDHNHGKNIALYPLFIPPQGINGACQCTRDAPWCLVGACRIGLAVAGIPRQDTSLQGTGIQKGSNVFSSKSRQYKTLVETISWLSRKSLSGPPSSYDGTTRRLPRIWPPGLESLVFRNRGKHLRKGLEAPTRPPRKKLDLASHQH
jgi:hypothetical protein